MFIRYTIHPSLKVADEIWISVAQLQEDEGIDATFSTGQIIEKLEKNKFWLRHVEGKDDVDDEDSPIRNGVRAHIAQHLVANAPNDENVKSTYRMLYRDKDTRYRLLLDGDEVSPKRLGGKRIPSLDDIPEICGTFKLRDETARLITWFRKENPKIADEESRSRKKPTRTDKYVRLDYDLYPYLRSRDRKDLIDNIKSLELSEKGKTRPTMVRVGYALKLLEDNKLLEGFMDVLLPRTRINPQYKKWYEDPECLLRPATQDAHASTDTPLSTQMAEASLKSYMRVRLESVYAFFDVEDNLKDRKIEVVETPIADHPEFQDGKVSVRIGHAIQIIRKEGLIYEFMDDAGIPAINPRYVELYERNNLALER